MMIMLDPFRDKHFFDELKQRILPYLSSYKTPNEMTFFSNKIENRGNRNTKKLFARFFVVGLWLWACSLCLGGVGSSKGLTLVLFSIWFVCLLGCSASIFSCGFRRRIERQVLPGWCSLLAKLSQNLSVFYCEFYLLLAACFSTCSPCIGGGHLDHTYPTILLTFTMVEPPQLYDFMCAFTSVVVLQRF